MFNNVFVKNTWILSFCHINQYLLLINFAQTVVFNAIRESCFFFIFSMLFVFVVMVFELGVVDPLPLRPAHAVLQEFNIGNPNRCVYSHAVYSLSLNLFGFRLFTTVHAWKCNTLSSLSQSRQHNTEMNIEENIKRCWC